MRFFRCLLGYLLALVATAAVLYRLRPDDDDFKAAFAEASRCNVLIVGPSYIKVGLYPDVFAAEAQALGHPLHVCKVARSALRGYEVMYDLEHLLERPWPKLRFVAVDLSLSAGNLGFDRDNWFTPRVVEWHTWEALTWVYRYYRDEKYDRKELARLEVAHLQHAAMNYLGVGRIGRLLTGVRLTEHLTGAERGEQTPKEVDRVRRKAKLAAPSEAEHDAAVRKLVHFKAKVRDKKLSADDDWPRQLEPMIHAAGFQPVFLYSPVYDPLTPPRLKRPRKRALAFLDFDDPERYPTLYTYDVRGRTSHLNQRGAVLYSKLLAREFVRLDSR
ncbi:MAG TPA: hypothetical protein VFV94_20745 [Polyangiaceae bacterium]|nr:hypothetical protein [Polyangiaceae bacterium]